MCEVGGFDAQERTAEAAFRRRSACVDHPVGAGDDLHGALLIGKGDDVLRVKVLREWSGGIKEVHACIHVAGDEEATRVIQCVVDLHRTARELSEVGELLRRRIIREGVRRAYATAVDASVALAGHAVDASHRTLVVGEDEGDLVALRELQSAVGFNVADAEVTHGLRINAGEKWDRLPDHDRFRRKCCRPCRATDWACPVYSAMIRAGFVFACPWPD